MRLIKAAVLRGDFDFIAESRRFIAEQHAEAGQFSKGGVGGYDQLDFIGKAGSFADNAIRRV